MQINAGYAGRFNIVVRNADGTVKQDLGWQDNLITDLGIKQLNHEEWFSNKNTKYLDTTHSIMGQLAVGSGTIEPNVHNTTLTKLEAFSIREENFTVTHEDPTTKRPHFLKETSSAKYIITNINNKNITEIGLGVSLNNNNVTDPNYGIFTHALIRDKQGHVSSITVLKGEILEVNYEISCYYDLRSTLTEIHIPVEENGQITDKIYNVHCQLLGITKGLTGQGLTVLWNDYNPIDFWEVSTIADPDLNVPYDFSRIPSITKNLPKDTIFQNMKHLLGTNKISMGREKTTKDAWDYSIEKAAVQRTVHQGGWTIEGTFSPYGANFENGIRCIFFPLGTKIFEYKAILQCIFAEKGSSRGIPKTNKQTISFTLQTSVSRYTGTP